MLDIETDLESDDGDWLFELEVSLYGDVTRGDTTLRRDGNDDDRVWKASTPSSPTMLGWIWEMERDAVEEALAFCSNGDAVEDRQALAFGTKALAFVSNAKKHACGTNRQERI